MNPFKMDTVLYVVIKWKLNKIFPLNVVPSLPRNGYLSTKSFVRIKVFLFNLKRNILKVFYVFSFNKKFNFMLVFISYIHKEKSYVP